MPITIAGGLCAILLAVGCAGGAEAPTVSGPPAASMGPEMDYIPELAAQGAFFAGTLTVNGETLEAELVPARGAALDLPFDGTPYLTGIPCTDCFKPVTLVRKPGFVTSANFRLVHPFDPATRPDLDVFDVRMILGAPGNVAYTRLPNTKAAAPPRLRAFGVPNADGYTQQFASVLTPVTPGTVNPYIDFFTESNPDPAISGTPIPFHRFAAGAPADVQTLDLDHNVLGTTVTMRVILAVHYGKAADKFTRLTPFYRNPQFNRKEPFILRASFPTNSLKEDDPASTASLRVEVADWQEGAPVVIDPLDPQAGEVDAVSDLSRVFVDFPTIFPDSVIRTTADSGSGTELDPYVFTYAIDNATFDLTEGEYTGIVMAEDTLDAASTDFEYKVYQVVRFSVLPADPPPGKGTWAFAQPAEQVSDQPGLSYLWPKEGVAVDSVGIAHVVWTDDSTGVDTAYYARQTGVGSGTWTTAEDFSGSSGATYYPTIAIDSTDTVHLTWEDDRDRINGQEIYYGTRAATGSAMLSVIRVTTLAENVFAVFPKVAVETAGTVELVWADHRNDPQVFPFGVADWGIYHATINVPTPATPSVGDSGVVIDGALAEGFPNLALDGGTIHVVYQENALAGTGARGIFHTSLVAGTWGTPVPITAGTDDGQPDIVVDALGNLHVAFSRSLSSDQIRMSASTDGGVSWGTVETVSEGGTTGYNQVVPDIAIDDLGDLHIVWHEFSGTTSEPGRIQYRRKDFDAEWHPTEFLTAPGTVSAFPSIAANHPSKNLSIAYQWWDGTDYEVLMQPGTYVPAP